MENIQTMIFWKKPSFILAIILVAFFLRGLFLVALLPIFSGPDETRHYNTIQYFAEPEKKTWPIFKKKDSDQVKGDMSTYRFSQEIRETFKNISPYEGDDLYNILDFSDNYIGKNEQIITNSQWHQYNEIYPPDVAATSKSLYHKIASYIERFFSSQSILVRFYLARIFSLILGTLVILCCYFITKNTGLSEKYSLLLTAIVSFQPRISMNFSYINYDAVLILAFSIFILGAVLSIKNGLNWKNILIMIASILMGVYSKGTALILLPIFLILFYKKINVFRKKRIIFLMFLILFIILLYIIQLQYNLLSIISINKISTIGHYLSDSLTIGRFEISAKTYWGDMQWSSNVFYGFILYSIWAVEIISAIGVILFLKKKENPAFLPEKKYIWFFIAMLTFLQLGIRFYDWKVFSEFGNFSLGTPGRYFLPNIVPHIILVFCGLSALIKKEKHLEIFLKAGLLFMFFFWFYLMINVVLPRYYM